jgi:hypothetical protein
MDDIQTAAKFGQPCLILLLLIHHRINVTRQDDVTLPSDFLRDFDIDRSAKWRGLKLLEKAKLITVKHEPGNSARVKLVARKKRKPLK